MTSGFIDGRVMAFSGDADGIIRCWDLADDPPRGKPLLGHSSAIRSLVLVPRRGNVTALASVSDDGTLRLWDVSTEQSEVIISDPTRPIQCLCTLQAGRLTEESRLAIASGDLISMLSTASTMATGWATINTVDVGTRVLSMISDDEDGILVTTELGITAIHIR
jgi:WD40 repeat protein